MSNLSTSISQDDAALVAELRAMCASEVPNASLLSRDTIFAAVNRIEALISALARIAGDAEVSVIISDFDDSGPMSRISDSARAALAGVPLQHPSRF